MYLPSRFNDCWFKVNSRKDITKFTSLGYTTPIDFWNGSNYPYDYCAIVGGVIYGFKSNHPMKALMDEIDPNDLDIKKEPIFLGFEIIHPRSGAIIYPITGHQIIDSDKFYEVKNIIKEVALYKREEFSKTSHLPGFNLDNISINVINQDFVNFKCIFSELSYSAVMAELNYYK